MRATYRLRYFFDWGTDACLWSGNGAARRAFGYPVDPQALPLSPQTRASIARLCTWHDTALNWDYPPDPGPWRQEDCDRFNAEASALLSAIRDELGPDYAVIDEFSPEREAPDLDAYLLDPRRFHRQS